ncbi:MAG: hypothetical protein IH861_14155 [Chloroflexi bacterium]|nr:hypothetical protein [Chloroflexota bacterium]
MKSILAKLGLIVFGVLLAVALMEGVVRLTQQKPQTISTGRPDEPPDPLSDVQRFLQSDPYTGWYLKPDVEGVYRKSCFESWVEINSEGFRDIEHTVRKEDGVYRIVVLGDSMTLSLTVDLEQTYPKVLERLLNESELGMRFEVFNLGMWSFGAGQEYLSLKRYGFRYEPDLVILGFYPNDLKDSSFALGHSPGASIRPYFAVDENGGLIRLPEPEYVPPPTPSPLQRPFLNRMLFNALGWLELYDWFAANVRDSPPLHNITWRLGLVERSQNPQYMEYLQRYPPEYEEAWQIVKALTLRMKQESEENNAKFLLVNLSRNPDLYSPGWKYLDTLTRQYDLDKPGRILEEFSQEMGVEYLNLVPSLDSYLKESGEDSTSLHFECDGHWTPLANQLAGEAIFDKIIDNLD